MANEFNIEEIMDLIPHRYPFLLVDRITDYTENTITGRKCVSMNEPFFQGHFPGQPIMPGVLQVEGMAQVAGCHIFKGLDNPKDWVVFFLGLDKVKFRKPVVPGDVIEYQIEILSFKGGRAKLSGKALVDGKVCSSALMTAMLIKRDR